MRFRHAETAHQTKSRSREEPSPGPDAQGQSIRRNRPGLDRPLQAKFLNQKRSFSRFDKSHGLLHRHAINKLRQTILAVRQPNHILFDRGSWSGIEEDARPEALLRSSPTRRLGSNAIPNSRGHRLESTRCIEPGSYTIRGGWTSRPHCIPLPRVNPIHEGRRANLPIGVLLPGSRARRGGITLKPLSRTQEALL